MVKLVYCVRRRDDVDAHDFHRYWLENHGPLVRGVADALRAVKLRNASTRTSWTAPVMRGRTVFCLADSEESP